MSQLQVTIFISDFLRPFDEGVKKFTYELRKNLENLGHQVLTISTKGDGCFHANPTLLDIALIKKLRAFIPDVIIYIPNASLNLLSATRARILKSYANSKLVMIALQPYSYGRLSQLFLPMFKPDFVFVQSKKTQKGIEKLDIKTRLIASGVDLEKFRPAGLEQKKMIRQKYGVDGDKFIITHVGHINSNRNIQLLKKIQKALPNVQILLIGSTSTPQDKRLKEDLESVGVKVITKYIEQIEEIYQLSDCYIFPIKSETASIEMPLSILEAMACNIPVVTTRFGGLPDFFEETGGIFFVDREDEIIEKIEEAEIISPSTRKLLEPLSWENVTMKILNALREGI